MPLNTECPACKEQPAIGHNLLNNKLCADCYYIAYKENGIFVEDLWFPPIHLNQFDVPDNS